MTTQLTAEIYSEILNAALLASENPNFKLKENFEKCVIDDEKFFDRLCLFLDEKFDDICKKYELIPDPETFKENLKKIYQK